jgi:DNA-binding response OmpR family regulator
MVVEDEPSLLEAIVFKLRQRNIEVVSAQTGEDALSLLKDDPPSLVWLDVLLPGINGLTVLQSIRSDKSTYDIPVVMVSVSASPAKIAQAKELGAIDYIVKSDHKIDTIIDRVSDMLKQIELQ